MPPRPPSIVEVNATQAAHLADLPAQEENPSLTHAAARLSLAQVVVLAGGLITGPLLARSLGATGRGHLAAIVVPVTLAAWLASLGIGSWVSVELARGRALGSVLGTTGLLSLGLGVVTALIAIPVTLLLPHDDAVVRVFMIIGFGLLPLSLFIQLLSCAAIGRSRWKLQARHRTLPIIVSICLTIALFAADELTLTAAASIFLVAGVISLVPLLPILREAWPLRFERGLVRQSVAFGARAWASNIGAITNARLDQLLMIPLVPASQLGLYAVAVTYAVLPSVVGSALMTVIAPRIATGDHALVGRGLRVTIGVMAIGGLVLAALAPLVLPLAFGAEFRPAVQMAWILLLAGVPLAGTVVLTTALTSLGKPGTPAIGQLVAAVLTVAGLLLLLPTMKAIGAAAVSLFAYSVALAFMLIATARHLKTTPTELLRPKREDLASAVSIVRAVRSRFLRLRGQNPTTPSG